MDIQDWELLPVDGFLDFHGDGEVKLYSPKRNSHSKSVLDSDYFRCPSPDSWKLVDPPGNPRSHNQFVPVGVQLDPEGDEAKEVTKLPIDESVVTAKAGAPDMEALRGAEDQDPVSQVSFKKTKEANEFADMKMDLSPRCGGVRGIVPPIEAFYFGERDEADENNMEGPISPRIKHGKREMVKKMDPCDGVSWEESKGGLKMWKWGLSGIGALCSFGVVAAATCCILILGSRQNHPKHNVRFQIYADDKRIKQVVHHATKLNEAISAVRGVPVTGAHITFGGYYDGL
ncbi:uncharacterized protein LOC116195339 [Punica granatum]|uniref:DUF6821 domain-containing protein n=2 Tax=Punica granatum TaxID=22663 RepID=A0A218X1K4_PUNGR|nr:uncharacterized protein LOC116195339 [Punica granatum]OWM78823.1 hypothetical protein CDL15_Pgr002994 [Punica granatum]PKI34063.1 hypothetical protein CRG98_045520 [Punica granatum]